MIRVSSYCRNVWRGSALVRLLKNEKAIQYSMSFWSKCGTCCVSIWLDYQKMNVSDGEKSFLLENYQKLTPSCRGYVLNVFREMLLSWFISIQAFFLQTRFLKYRARIQMRKRYTVEAGKAKTINSGNFAGMHSIQHFYLV